MKKGIGTWLSLAALCVVVIGAVSAAAYYFSKNCCGMCDYDDDDFDFDFDEDDDVYCCKGDVCEDDDTQAEYTKGEAVEPEALQLEELDEEVEK